jgi:NAD(P)-dependent dehydrogenase (short-subunit alcohol dehydrogenase family)
MTDRQNTESTASRPVALVSGAASGIGRAVASRFDQGGWDVLAIDLDGAALDRLAWPSDRVRTATVDVTDETAVTRVLAETGQPALAACVNVAGIYPPSTFLAFDQSDYRRTFDVNVLGTLVLARAAVPYLRANGGGAIVNFASTGAFAAGDGQRVLYKASKAAVVSLTRSMAYELAAEGIVVLALAPGPVVTEGSTASGDVYAYADQVPLKRLGQPHELADWVWALAGSDRLTYATGETIVVSGGAFMR